MTISLNHAIVPALDNRRAARFFASVMGLRELDNGRVDHPLCPRGLFFTDEARNLYEVMSPA